LWNLIVYYCFYEIVQEYSWKIIPIINLLNILELSLYPLEKEKENGKAYYYYKDDDNNDTEYLGDDGKYYDESLEEGLDKGLYEDEEGTIMMIMSITKIM